MSVTTYLMGGVGNAMFQYGAGLGLARRLNTDLLIDNSRYDQLTEFRMYSLGLFAGVNEQVVKGMRGTVLREQGMPHQPELFERAAGDVTLLGYFQTERYIMDLKDELRERFRPRAALPEQSDMTLRQIVAEGEHSVFLTIRRTDYVGNDFHGLLPYEYYRDAADLIAYKVDDPCFFIFTDDPDWCREHFYLPFRTVLAGNFDRTVRPHLGREDAELWLMRSCRHAILANSSYSWWGAWLGRADQGGIVVAPKRWFGPASHEDTRDICPARWIKL